MISAPPPHPLPKKIVGTKFFLIFVGGVNLYGGELKLYGGNNITISLFHFFRNSQNPEKWSVSVKNFFRKCECISSCISSVNAFFFRKCECISRISSGNVNASISSILLKNSLRKTSFWGLFELLPTGLYNCVWPFVTTHEWANNFPGFLGRTLMEK